MRKILLLIKKEWSLFLRSPYGIVITTLFLVLCGIYFYAKLDMYLGFVQPGENEMRVSGVNIHIHLLTPFFSDLLNIFIFLVPIMTMRTFAEERKLGTYELLISYPIRPWELLIGKYLGNLSIALFLLVLSFPFCAFVLWKGEPYLPQMMVSYVGLVFFLFFYVAIGVVGSLLTENQIVAALISYGIFFSMSLFQWLAYVVKAPWDRFFANFLLISHLNSFREGLLFLGDAAVFLCVTIAVLIGGYWKLRSHFIR